MVSLLKILSIIILFQNLNFGQNRVKCSEKFLTDQTVSNFFRHLNYLGSDSLEGRATGSKGSKLASEYIKNIFTDYKLSPYESSNGFYQNIPMHSNFPKTDSRLTIHQDTSDTDLVLFEDYLLQKTGDQTFTPVPKDLVFAGYGIIAPEYDYSDYEDLDVFNKIVIVLGDEPFSENESFFHGKYPTIYSYPETKQRFAFSRGAAGIIILPPENISEEYWESLVYEYYFDDVTLAYTVNSILTVLLNNSSAELLLNNELFDYSSLQEMHLEKRIRNFELSKKVSFKGIFERKDFVERNVIGLVKGTDPKLKDEVVIVSSHFDHLGIGLPVEGDSVYNGVFDNAAGTAVMLELAGILAQTKTKRTFLFMGLTGEEKGLLGSSYYTENPIFPLHKTIANINIDGVPSFDEIKSLVAVGKEFSNLGEILRNSIKGKGLELEDLPSNFYSFEAFAKSDQLSFAQAGIPSLLVVEGTKHKNITQDEYFDLQRNYFNNFYHSPKDDLNQKINRKAIKQFIGVLADFLCDLANYDGKVEWNNTSPYLREYLRNRAEQR
jgi:hypothetical protein